MNSTFLPHNYAYVTHVAPFNKKSTKIPHLGNFEHSIAPFYYFASFVDITAILARCSAAKSMSTPSFSIPFPIVSHNIFNARSSSHTMPSRYTSERWSNKFKRGNLYKFSLDGLINVTNAQLGGKSKIYSNLYTKIQYIIFKNCSDI
jgi:hypothetical protein